MLGCSVAVPLSAQEVTNHNNRLYFTVGAVDDLTRVPISFYLENPAVGITAVETYLNVPEGVTVSEITMSDARCTQTHELVEGNTENGHFISIASEKLDQIIGTDGEILTMVCNLSALPDGEYSIAATGMFAVSVDVNGVLTYTAPDQTESFIKNGNEVTGIAEIESSASGVLQIYNMQGIRLPEPQKGQINIINGKKVKL